MAVNLSPVGGVAAQFFDNDGNVLSGGKIYTYAAGTSTPQATYTTGAGSIAHSNPIILDSGGRVPSGEIWLTDGLSYKFVLNNSSNVLIGTYDNITGINSNFINFLAEQEIQTATANQTVFTLTTTNYQPNTNTLSVFVDGVNQYGPGAQYAYTETSSTVVTFTNGLHVGASVKFTTTQALSGGAVDASLVTYDPPFTGSVITNVETKLSEYISVQDFGAVGNGVTNDTAAIQDAIDYVANNGGGVVYAPPNSTGYVAYGLILKPLVRLVGGGGVARIETALAAQYDLKQTTFLVPAGETGITVDIDTGHCSLENIRIQGVAGGGIGIDCQTYNFKTTNVGVNGFLDGIGVILAENYRASHENLDIQLCGLGLYLKDDCNGTSFVNLIIENVSVGIYSDGTNRGVSYHACTIESCKTGIGGTSFPSTALLTVAAQTLTDVGFANQTLMEGGAYLQGVHSFQSGYFEDNASVNIYVSSGSVDLVASYLNDWLVGTAKPVYMVDGRRATSVSIRNSYMSTENSRATPLLRFSETNFNVVFGNDIFDHTLGTPYTGTLYYTTGSNNLNGLLQRAAVGGRMDNLQINDLYITSSANNPVLQTTDSNRNIIIDPHGTGEVQTTKRIVASAASGANSVVRANNSTAVGNVYGFESYLQSNANSTSSYHFRGSTDSVGAWFLYGNGTTSFTSDATRKKNIETTRNGYLQDFARLRVVKYNWKTQEDGEPKELGLIAQEVEEVFPGLVQEETEPSSAATHKVIKGSVLIPMLIKCVQELNEKVNVLEQELKSRN